MPLLCLATTHPRGRRRMRCRPRLLAMKSAVQDVGQAFDGGSSIPSLSPLRARHNTNSSRGVKPRCKPLHQSLPGLVGQPCSLRGSKPNFHPRLHLVDILAAWSTASAGGELEGREGNGFSGRENDESEKVRHGRKLASLMEEKMAMLSGGRGFSCSIGHFICCNDNPGAGASPGTSACESTGGQGECER